MPLHLLKLAVGAASIADIEAHIEARLAARRAAGEPVEQVHTTRMVPKRVAEILDGGSLYWVIRGQVAARQPILAVRPFTDRDGIGRCDLVLEPTVVPVLPRPCRPFQGWRYLAAETAPADLARFGGAAEMPEALRRDLAELCLIRPAVSRFSACKALQGKKADRDRLTASPPSRVARRLPKGSGRP